MYTLVFLLLLCHGLQADPTAMAQQLSQLFSTYMNVLGGADQAQLLLDHSIRTIVDVDGAVRVSSLATQLESLLAAYSNLLVQHQNSTPHQLFSAVNTNKLLPDMEGFYVGTSDGRVTHYDPAHPKKKHVLWDRDARSMSWFVGSVTPRKDVVFLLDTTMSADYWNATLQGVYSVIHSLLPHDYVQAVVVQGKQVQRFPGSSYGLTRATVDVKHTLMSWLSTFSTPSSTPDLEAGIRELYQIMDESVDRDSLRSNSSNCVKLGLLVSASAEAAVFQDLQAIVQDREIDITLHSWLLGESAVRNAADYAADDFYHSSGGFYELSCSHQGVWTSVPQLEDVSESLLSWYRLVAAGYRRSQPLWTLGLGSAHSLLSNKSSAPTLPRLTVSLPLYDSSENYPVVEAVLALDIRFDSILGILEKEEVGFSYPFLLSRFGESLIHPRSPPISSTLLSPTDPLFYDISLVEPSFQQDSVRSALVQSISTNFSFVLDLPTQRGDTGEGFDLRRIRVHFFARRVEDSPFIIAFALTQDDVRKHILEAPAPRSPTAFLNEHILIDQNATAFLPPGYALFQSDQLRENNIEFASFTHSSLSGIYHTRIFGDAELYLQRVRAGDVGLTQQALVHLNDLTLTSDALAQSPLSLSELLLNPAFEHEVKRWVQLTAGMDTVWRIAEYSAFLNPLLGALRQHLFFVILGTDPGGLLRTWPGFPQSAHEANPVTLAWFQRGRAYPDRITLSQPFDTLGQNDEEGSTIGRTIALAKALYYDSSQPEAGVAAVLTTNMEYVGFYNVSLAALGCPRQRLSDGGLQCAIMDLGGNLLMVPEFNDDDPFRFLRNDTARANSLLFAGEREPELTQQLIDADILQLQKQTNYRTQRIEYSYTLNEQPFTDAATVSGSLQRNSSMGYCSSASQYVIAPIPGHNVYLVLFYGYTFVTGSSCRSLKPPASEPLQRITAQYPRPLPSCEESFHVLDMVLESQLRSSEGASCEQSENPEIVWIEWSSAEAIAISSVTVVAAVVTLLILIFLMINYRKSVVRFSSVMFVCFMLLGAQLGYAVILLSIGEPSSVSCTIQLWLGVLCFLIVFGSMIIKTYRIYSIFRGASNLKRVVLPNQTVAGYLLLLMIIPLCLLTVWTALEPLDAISYDDNADEDKETLRCGSHNETLALILGGLLAAYAGAMILCAAFLAFEVRHVKKEIMYGEARYMAIGLYNFMIFGSAGIILYVVLKSTPSAAFLTFSVGLLLALFGTLLILFVPKLYLLWRGIELDRSGSSRFHPTSTTDMRTSTASTSTPHNIPTSSSGQGFITVGDDEEDNNNYRTP